MQHVRRSQYFALSRKFQSIFGLFPGQQTSSEDDEQDDPKTIVDKRKEGRKQGALNRGSVG